MNVKEAKRRKNNFKLSSMLPAVIILSGSFALSSFFSNCQATIGHTDGTIGDAIAACLCYAVR